MILLLILILILLLINRKLYRILIIVLSYLWLVDLLQLLAHVDLALLILLIIINLILLLELTLDGLKLELGILEWVAGKIGLIILDLIIDGYERRLLVIGLGDNILIILINFLIFLRLITFLATKN